MADSASVSLQLSFDSVSLSPFGNSANTEGCGAFEGFLRFGAVASGGAKA